LTLLETLIALVLITLLLSILLPALSTARIASHREQSQANLAHMGQGWMQLLEAQGRTFPFIPVQPAWHYGGMRFSAVDNVAFPDYDRPLNGFLPLSRTDRPEDSLCCCPADRGITDADAAVGTGTRTAFRAYGTSYRANAALFDVRLANLAPPSGEARGMTRAEVTTTPSRMLLMGEPFWYEASEETGRNADWYGKPDSGNVLFLDGSVRFVTLRSRKVVGPVIFDPIMPGGPTEAAPQSQPLW
jgi:prepilin-type processing-associated H-X9-DG protein